jgi:hypothetical protein
VFSSRLGRLSEPQAGQLAANYSVLPWGDGSVTTESSPPPVQRNAGIGLLLGLLLGTGLVVLQSQWRPLVVSGSEPELARLRIAAVLPESKRRSRASVADTMIRLAELLERCAGPEPWVLVTGPASARRRARFAADLAEAFTALGGRDVDVVDAEEHGRHAGRPGGVLAQLQRPGDTGQRKAVVVKGPELPGSSPVLRLLPLVDVVVLLAEIGQTTTQALVLADTMLEDESHRPILTVLLEGTELYIEPSPAAAGRGTSEPHVAALASADGGAHPRVR